VSERPSQTAVIVTVLDVETRAVLRQLGDWNEEVVQGTVFYQGTFEHWNIAVAEAGPGNIGVAAVADRAIGHFKANVALFVGVAGGRLSAIRQFDGPVFTAFDGQGRGTSVPSWPDFPIPVPARCRDGGKRNWEFGARAPVSW